jgi:hypothetical protein
VLTAFHTNSRGFKTTFDQLSAEKGLAFYDRHDDLETLLKNIVDLYKDVLRYVSELVDCIPGIGLVLDPSMSLLLPLIPRRLLTDLH